MTQTIKTILEEADMQLINHDKLMKHDPCLFDTILGVSYYENPTHGDEAPVIAACNGIAAHTCWWEIPDDGFLPEIRQAFDDAAALAS
jgi:hypothetical protein